MMLKRFALTTLAIGMLASAASAGAEDIKIALITSKTGPLEAYAKQTETGFMMGLNYLTNGTMTMNGRKIVVITKDDQFKPDLGKALLSAAYNDDKVDIAVGTTGSGIAGAMLPVAEENKKILIVEPAVAEDITGSKWNRYIFRTSRNSFHDACAGAATTMEKVNVAFLVQDNAFGKEGVKASMDCLTAMKSKATVVHVEYAPPATTDFTAATQRMIDALKDKQGPKFIAIGWAGANPIDKVNAIVQGRYGITLLPGGNILPVMKGWKQYAGAEGAVYYYYGFPHNKMNDWLVAEHKKQFNGAPPDFFVAGGVAAASAVITALKKTNGSPDAEKLIAAMEGMDFDTPKGKMTFRKEDHQAMQPMYHFRIKEAKDQKDEWDILSLVREIPASELVIPIRNKR
ncbi:MAG: substrate-binding domain-containing protein [Burkholderiaceae bacterium]